MKPREQILLWVMVASVLMFSLVLARYIIQNAEAERHVAQGQWLQVQKDLQELRAYQSENKSLSFSEEGDALRLLQLSFSKIGISTRGVQVQPRQERKLATPGFVEQSVVMTLPPLLLPDIGAWLNEWRQIAPQWQVESMTLRHAQASRTEREVADSNQYTVHIVCSAHIRKGEN